MGLAEAAALGGVLALASRATALYLHRRWFRQGFAGDSSIHWAIIRTLKRRPRARWIAEYVIAPEPMSYPTGFHRVAALFPLRVVEAQSWLPNLVLWVVGVASFAGYTAYAAHSVLGVPSAEVVWFSLGFLLVVPSAVVFRGPAVAYLKLSERLLGRLATSAAVLLLVVGTEAHDSAPSLVAAAVAVAIASVSSIFARQAIGFGLPLLALAWLDWRPLAVLACGAALAVLLGRSRFLQGMRHTWIQWSVVYPHLTKASDHFTPALSHFVRPAELRRALRDSRVLNRIVVDKEPVRALVMYPEVVAVLVLLGLTPGLGWHWAAPVTVFVALYLATSTQRLNHLGEAYRYLEYGLLFVVPLELALLVQEQSSALGIALLAGFTAWSVLLLVALVPRWVRSLPDRDVLGDFLQQLDLRSGDVVFPVTMGLGADVCARVDGVRSFWWQPGVAATSIYDEFVEELPYLKRDYRPLVERYAVTHVICEKAALAAISWSYDFSGLEPLAEDERYEAFLVPADFTG